MPQSERLGFARVRARDYPYDGAPPPACAERSVAVETPVNLLFGGVPFAVMMATPADLEDFAIGFAFTEGIVESLRDIRGVEAEVDARGVRLNIALSGDRMSAHLARGRALSGRTGCGLCGVQDFDQLPQLRPVAASDPIAPAAVKAALQALERAQPLNAETHAVHAAAWCDRAGALVAAREDVGRHNALDKLIGALLRARATPADGFFVITSRCSFEMAAKAALFGASTLVAVSAPTSLALERAEACGLKIIAIARADHAQIFSEGEDAAKGGLAA